MKAGARREVVTIIRLNVTTSNSGGEKREREVIGTERASYRLLNAREMVSQSSEVAQADCEFVMTWPTVVAITEQDVLEWEGARFDVVAVNKKPGSVPETVVRARRGAALRNG